MDRTAKPADNCCQRASLFDLIIVPWPTPIEVPPGWLAIFAASTCRWKKRPAPLIEALDAFVNDFVCRQQRLLEQINLVCHPHTEPHLYFLYQVFVTES